MKENVKQYILILEDDEDLSEGICLSLQSPELTFVRCKTVAQAKQLLKERITKPFSLMVLRARIRALLRRNVPEQRSEYRKGCFHFLFDRMEFYKNGQAVDLSKTERRILHLLVFHEGQIITRERLMDWVWPDGAEYVEDNALSVGIRRLRDKLEDMPSRPEYIRTVYGKGYVWEME